mmetsp:Transcript_24337/g.65812  ORF Transcript_24337/g.65812 Transcript_24337/m.65812 type:complete len:491 (-) Transcript_24337:197-1669(-)
MVLRSLLSAVLVMDGVRSAMSLVNCTNDLYSAATSGCKDDCSGNGLCWSSFDASTLTWSEEAICHCENWFTGASCSVRTVESMEVVPTLVDQFDGQHVDMTVLFEGVGTDGEDVEVTENGTVLTPEQTNAVEPTIRIPADAFDEARSSGYNLTLIVANPDAKYQRYPSVRFEIKWIVADIDANGPGDASTVALPWWGSKCPEDSFHRYTFLLFKQLPGADWTTYNSSILTGVDLSGLITTYKLEPTPVAVKVAMASWDSYVSDAPDVTPETLGLVLNSFHTTEGLFGPNYSTGHNLTVAWSNGSTRVAIPQAAGTAVDADAMLNEPLLTFLVDAEGEGEPTATTTDAIYTTRYTVGFFDPDAPVSVSNTYATFGHMLVGNVVVEGARAEDLRASDAGEVIFAYRNPHPAEPRDHRYTIVVWKQPQGGPIVFDEEKVLDGGQDGRCFFQPTDFASKYGLGDPIGVATALVQNTSFAATPAVLGRGRAGKHA